MNNTDRFAIVPRPKSDLEQAEPNTSRLLSGMVRDTLVLAEGKALGRAHESCIPRIIVVDDEPWFVEMVSLTIRDWFKKVNLIPCLNEAGAWRDLNAATPDLLILGMVPLGDEILPRLVEQNVRYPILATSGYHPESYVRGKAGPRLKLGFLQKPFTGEQLYHHLRTHFGSTPEFILSHDQHTLDFAGS